MKKNGFRKWGFLNFYFFGLKMESLSKCEMRELEICGEERDNGNGVFEI